MPVGNRTAMADIVLSGSVIKTFKEKKFRTEANTYTATVKLFDVFKGKKLIRNIEKLSFQPDVYNISNFGDRKMCYADVQEGKNYIFFLTTYRQRLSAKYDDIFGATVPLTDKNAEEVLKEVGSGKTDWLEWSSCSVSCGNGHQVRKRNCSSDSGPCDTDTMDRRSCNMFECQDAVDLLSYLGIYKLPLGVHHVHARPGAFRVHRSAKLYFPLSDIYPSSLPQQYSLMFSMKISPKFSGYFFSLSDLQGVQKMGLHFSEINNNSVIKFELRNSTNSSNFENLPHLEFKFPTRNSWWRLALSVGEKEVTVVADCETISTRAFTLVNATELNSNLVVALGTYYTYGKSFEGEIEQLSITDNTDAAQMHCSSDLDNPDRPYKDEGNNEIDDMRSSRGDTTKLPGISVIPQVTTLASPPDPDIVAQWTEWSPCSRTCGRGVQTRTQYCGNNVLSNCVEAGLESEQARWCFMGNCDGTCPRPCENGGKCLSTGTCFCPRGYSGPTCSEATCMLECLNGGSCVAVDTCACAPGYTGRFCENAICEPPCANGGFCLQPGYCTCPYGYMPPKCEPICVLPCRNSGRCVGPNKCKCRKGFVGPDCSIPVCRRGCYNGGRCVAPGICTCPRGFTGSRCQRPVCLPACQNGGKCLYPGVCKCRRGYSGSLCENLVCRKPCQNGGVCAGNNRCACPEGFRGRWCHKIKKNRKCQVTCLNGGKCRKKRCRCKPGFTGMRCEIRRTKNWSDKT